MKEALIDTDTLSYFFRNQPEVVAMLDKYLEEHGFVNLSVITYYEVLNGLYFKDAKNKLTSFEEFVALNEVLPLTDEIAKKAAEIYASLRKKGVIVGHNDIMIASTAIVNDMVLITNNTKHFKDIEGLEIENWAKRELWKVEGKMRKSPKPIFENSHYLVLPFKMHCMNTEEKLKGIQAVLGAPEVRTDNERESEEEIIALFTRLSSA